MRDELWARALKKTKESGTVLQVWTDKNPQGFSYRQTGNYWRKFVDFEGLALVTVGPRQPKLQEALRSDELS